MPSNSVPADSGQSQVTSLDPQSLREVLNVSRLVPPGKKCVSIAREDHAASWSKSDGLTIQINLLSRVRWNNTVTRYSYIQINY